MVIGGQEQRVVMKRSKPRVARSLEMGEIEIILNQAVKKRASGACADYIGHMQVSGEQAKPRVGLSEGLWLVRGEGECQEANHQQHVHPVQAHPPIMLLFPYDGNNIFVHHQNRFGTTKASRRWTRTSGSETF
jgi:hypothetical protein